MSQQPETGQETGPEIPHVDFGEVASESIDESVEHEREITIADELEHPGQEPYDPEAAAHDEAVAHDEQAAPLEPLVGEEPTEGPVATGDEVVNSITAAVRR